jgi:hypothetical protein
MSDNKKSVKITWIDKKVETLTDLNEKQIAIIERERENGNILIIEYME